MIARVESSEPGTINRGHGSSWRCRHKNGTLAKTSVVTDINYVNHPSFRLPDTENKLWGPNRPDIPVSCYSLPQEMDEDDNSQRPRHNKLTAEQEKMLFLRYNYAKYRLSRLLRRKSSTCYGRVRKQLKIWQSRAETIRNQITHANLPLVPSMASRYKSSRAEFADMVSEGSWALLRAIEHFNVSRGFKFSTYACRAILSSFHRLNTKSQIYRKHVPVNFDPELQGGDEIDRRHDQQMDSAAADVRDVVLRNRADLTGTELAVLLGRFPIMAGSTRLTLAQLGRRMGVSNERVRQIEGACLSKLREVMEERFAS